MKAYKVIATKSGIRVLLQSFTDEPKRKSKTTAQFHFIIYGASGLAGRHTVEAAVKLLKNYSWAVAGRNEEKLKKMLDDIGHETVRNLSKVPIIIANCDNQLTLNAMASKCDVLINCCGPYTLYGEALIKSCLAVGTHYVDISFEPDFITEMHKTYNDQAIKNGVYIVNSCGFQCFANEMFINKIDKIFDGKVKQINCYARFSDESGEIERPIFSSEFWRSLVYSLTGVIEKFDIPQNFGLNTIVNFDADYHERSLIHKARDVGNTVNIACPLIEQQVFGHSQELLQKMENKTPILFNKYLAFPTFFYAFLFLLWFILSTILIQAGGSRELVLYLPSIFSCGYANSAVCTENLKKLKYHIKYYIICKQPTGNNKQSVLKRRHMVGELSGANPFYGFTSASVLTSAITVLEKTSQLPSRGGVYTPSVAFRNIDVLEKLQSSANNFTFEIIEEDEGKRKIWCLM